MSHVLHITAGDCSGDCLAKSGIPGEVFVWHDIMYEGPRNPGWPDEATLQARAAFLERATGGGLSREVILPTLQRQYQRLQQAAGEQIVLWFDACLFDQSMLAHILACLDILKIRTVELLCVDAFPGIEPFDGLGQLAPSQLASLFTVPPSPLQRGEGRGEGWILRRLVTEEQFLFAAVVDRAFATQEAALCSELAHLANAPLPWVPAAVARWLQERPDPRTGLGRLAQLALDAIRAGCEHPQQIYAATSSGDTHPQFWGDTTLWAKINELADRKPPLVKIAGPQPRLPQWGVADLKLFSVTPVL